jgi:hypothetical protein
VGPATALVQDTLDDQASTVLGQSGITVGLSVTLSLPPLRW